MANKKHIVELTTEERANLLELVSKNKANRAKIVNAYILLKADAGEHGEKWTDEKIAEAFNVSVLKVYRTRQKIPAKPGRAERYDSIIQTQWNGQHIHGL